FHLGLERCLTAHGPGFRERSRIFDDDADLQRPEVTAMETFGAVHLLGVRMPGRIDPGNVVEADGVDYERLSVPMRARVSIESGLQVGGMLASIHVELAIHVRVALEQ